AHPAAACTIVGDAFLLVRRVDTAAGRAVHHSPKRMVEPRCVMRAGLAPPQRFTDTRKEFVGNQRLMTRALHPLAVTALYLPGVEGVCEHLMNRVESWQPGDGRNRKAHVVFLL